jgi:hypothetical protein
MLYTRRVMKMTSYLNWRVRFEKVYEPGPFFCPQQPCSYFIRQRNRTNDADHIRAFKLYCNLFMGLSRAMPFTASMHFAKSISLFTEPVWEWYSLISSSAPKTEVDLNSDLVESECDGTLATASRQEVAK